MFFACSYEPASIHLAIQCLYSTPFLHVFFPLENCITSAPFFPAHSWARQVGVYPVERDCFPQNFSDYRVVHCRGWDMMRSVGTGSLAFWPCFCEILRSPELVRPSTVDAEAIPIFDHSSLRREKWISPRRHHLWDYFFHKFREHRWSSLFLRNWIKME